MQSYNDFYERKLKELIHDSMERVTDVLINGYAVTDHAHYRYLTGQIVGLRAALELCDEAKDLANKALR